MKALTYQGSKNVKVETVDDPRLPLSNVPVAVALQKTIETIGQGRCNSITVAIVPVVRTPLRSA